MGFEDCVRVGRSEMMWEGIPKGRACRKPREARVMLIRGWERRFREAERS